MTYAPNKLTVVTRDFGCDGRTINGLRLASMMVGPGELLPIAEVASIEVGQSVTVGTNVWVRLPDSSEPIVAEES